MRIVKLTLAAAALSVGCVVSASAMPMQSLGTEVTGNQVDQVRLVCNRWGRCWHVYGGYRGYYGGYGWRRHYGYGWGYRRGYRWHRW